MKNTRAHLKHFALALALGAGLGVGSAPAQTILEVGGDGVIGDETLTTDAGVATLPANGATFTASGGTGFSTSILKSPTVTVTADGPVILSFDHRYFIEAAWDGAAVFVSVNGAPATYLPGAAFSAEGYVGDTLANNGSAWPGGETVFYGISTDYALPGLIESVAELGTFSTGDTISVEFRILWDGAYYEPDINWEIAGVRIDDAAPVSLLDVDFVADGTAGFTVINDASPVLPFTYPKAVSTFEIDGDLKTSDRYAPDIAGSVIDLNDASVAVELLTGTLEAGDELTLFDLSGGTTLTGSIGTLTLPPGLWDTSTIGLDGKIVLLLPPAAGGLTPGADFEVDARLDSDGNDIWEDVIGSAGIEFFLDTANGVGRVATGSATQLAYAYDFPGNLSGDTAPNSDEAGYGGGKLVRTGDASGECYSFQDGPTPAAWDTKDVSIEIWFKPDDLASTPANGQILYEDGGGTGFGLFLTGSQLVSSQDNNEAGSQISYDLGTDPSGLLIAPATTEFIQCVVTRVASGATEMFINGTSVGTSDDADGDWTGGDGFSLGARGEANAGGRGGGDAGTLSFDGQIALFRVYSEQILTATEVVANFNSVVDPDTTPPAYTSLTPPNLTPDYFAGLNLEATFTEDIALTGTGSVTIRNLDTASDTVITLPDAAQVTVSGNTLTIDPTDFLAYDTNFAILISADAIEDLAPTPNPFAGISDPTRWTFKTLPADTTPPVVADLSPADDSMNISPITNFVVTFDEDIVVGTGNITLKNLSNPGSTVIDVTDGSQVTIAGNVLTVDPADPLAGGDSYAIQIDSGAVNNLIGLAFGGIAGDTTWNLDLVGAVTFTANNTQWTDSASWTPAVVPAPGIDATIGAGNVAVSSNSVPEWGGTLTLEAGSRLSIRDNATPPHRNPLEDATTVFLNGGAIIGDSFRSLEDIDADFVLNGGGGFQQDSGTSGWNRDRRFNGVFSGTGPLTIDAENHMGYGFYSANTYTGGLVVDSGNRYGVGFYAAGSAGAGDVTVNAGNNADMRSAVLFVRANDVFAASCVLTLNGLGWNNSTGGFGPYAGNFGQVGTQVRIIMDGFNATVDKLFIDDVQQEAGDYTEASGDWIAGSGTLTVLTGPITEYGSWAALYAPADLADPEADLDGDGLNNDYERIFGLDPTDPLSQNPVAVPLDPAAGTFRFTRRDDALSGLFSGVETSTDLVMWTEDSGATLTPGAPDAFHIETVEVTLSPGLLAAPKLFVRAVQDDGVLFAANFEAGDGGFTVATTAGSDWEFGDPDSLGLGGEVIEGNGGSTNCWGTDIGNPGEYAVPTATKLRSPVIDLTGVTGAQLTFAQAMDLELADTAIVNIIEEAGDTVIATVYTAADADINTADWEAVPAIDLAPGVGMKVRLEWAFTGGTLEYLGWYIDDVTVSKTVPAVP